MVYSAIEIADWFIKENYDTPRNNFDGNMKLQKLLFFSQLIHLANYNEPLFDDEMCAYKNGTVINNVRFYYKKHHNDMVQEANEKVYDFDSKVVNTLNLTASIFGEMSAMELSNLNHELDSWKIAFEASRTEKPNYYIYEKSLIKIDSVLDGDVQRVKQMLEAFVETSEDTDLIVEVINGISFYYNPGDIILTDEVLEVLENFQGIEKSYNIYNDPEQGLVIY